jgi:hypothetical protein
MARNKKVRGGGKLLAPESEILQKPKIKKSARYTGPLASEKEIIQEGSLTFKDNRYR